MSEKPNKAVQKEETTAPAKKNLMYVGPTITGVIVHSTVYKDGVLPEKVLKCIETLPAMRSLFVDLATMPKVVKQINHGEGAVSAIYQKVKETFN